MTTPSPDGRLTGGEVGKILTEACIRTGMTPEMMGHLLVNFTIVWGEMLLTDMDKVIFAQMTEGLDVPDQPYRGDDPEQQVST